MTYKTSLTRRAMALAAGALMLITAEAVLVTAPVQAAAPCTGAGQFGPYWWGAEKATRDRNERVVLAIESLWVAGAGAYIWNYNNDNRQKFCMEKFGLMSNGVQIWRFRYAHNTSLCLEANSTADLARLTLRTCTSGGSLQTFYRNYTGKFTDPEEPAEPFYTYQWKTVAGDKCLDVKEAGSADGTHVILFTCVPGNLNQRWY